MFTFIIYIIWKDDREKEIKWKINKSLLMAIRYNIFSLFRVSQ